MSWDDIGFVHNTDKARIFRETGQAGHGYCDAYERILGRRADGYGSILELGVDQGASLNLWADVFPYATIAGIDLHDHPRQIAHPDRTHIIIGDCTDAALLSRVAADHGPFDAIVDDASHDPRQIALSYAQLHLRLKPGGWYFVEDLYRDVALRTLKGLMVQGIARVEVVPDVVSAAKFIGGPCLIGVQMGGSA